MILVFLLDCTTPIQTLQGNFNFGHQRYSISLKDSWPRFSGPTLDISHSSQGCPICLKCPWPFLQLQNLWVCRLMWTEGDFLEMSEKASFHGERLHCVSPLGTFASVFQDCFLWVSVCFLFIVRYSLTESWTPNSILGISVRQHLGIVLNQTVSLSNE